MNLSTLFRCLSVGVFCLFFASGALAQGNTTANVSGKITDNKGEAMIGANIVALHTPTGTIYGTSSGTDGQFLIPNLRVGGPYTLTVSYTGYQDVTEENVYLKLGQTYRKSFVISEDAVVLGAVVVTSSRELRNEKTGASTTISEDQILNLPTVARAIGDFARLTPQATVREGNDGFSISLNGVNNRYNAIYIDGAVNNDVFGLAGSGTNGGQTGVSPFSVDAIEEFQVQLAPFDVRVGGFAGGAINAITRSGSNNIEGSAYYYFRNQSTAGKTPTDNRFFTPTRLADFTASTYGFRIGGPIIKNKVFFFVNAEIQRDEIPLPFDFSTYSGDASREDLTSLENKLSNDFGYNPGPFDANESFLNSEKITARFDFNISRQHKLSLRHSYIHAENLEGVQSNPRTINYKNSSEFFNSTTNNTSLELNSTFNSTVSNSLIVGYTAVRDDRDPFGNPFPYVSIDDGRGTIVFGSERFSTANLLNQDIFTVTNNLQFYKGKHTLTFGTHNEFYSVDNLFIAFNYGEYQFGSLSAFMNDEGSNFFQRSYSLRDNIVGDESQAVASFTGAQLGFYVQDEMQLTNQFRLTAGLRFDLPVFSSPPENNSFNNETIGLLEDEGYDLKGATVGEFISPQLMISPRVGFNWDLKGDQTTILRGGVGVFTSRVPLVWPGGAYNNFGLNIGYTRAFGEPFNPDINGQLPGEINPGSVSPTGSIDLFASDFKLPQVLKFNLAVDHTLPWGLIGNLDFIYNKTLQNVAYENINLRQSVGNLSGTGDDRPIFDRRDEIDPSYGRIILASNTSEGYTYNFTASLTKSFDNGFSGMVAYSYGDAFTVFDGTSSQNSSQWRGLNSVGGRNFDQPLTRSDFSQGSRIISAVSYQLNWNEGKNLATTFSLFYEGISGQPYSYIYNDNGNLTEEDSRERALIYVPRDQNDIVLVDDGRRSAEKQWEQLNEFIERDDYLSERRGQYAERNQSRAPWSSVIDLKILQDFNLYAGGKKHTMQLSLDIFNLTNLINRNLGRRYFVPSFGQFQLLNFEGFQEDANGEETTIPTFTFDGVTDNNPAANSIDDAGVQSSRWQIQIGIRYIFK